MPESQTGTLTEDDLALAGVIPCTEGDMGSPVEDVSHLEVEQPLTRALATCHSLTSINGKLVGYPIDTKIFSGIGWVREKNVSLMHKGRKEVFFVEYHLKFCIYGLICL